MKIIEDLIYFLTLELPESKAHLQAFKMFEGP